jgi:hypothetical protein
MKFVATQKSVNKFGTVSFLVSPVDGSSFGKRLQNALIDWTVTALA